MSQERISTSLFDPAARRTPEWQLHWLFRLALCAEFVGLGVVGDPCLGMPRAGSVGPADRAVPGQAADA